MTWPFPYRQYASTSADFPFRTTRLEIDSERYIDGAPGLFLICLCCPDREADGNPCIKAGVVNIQGLVRSLLSLALFSPLHVPFIRNLDFDMVDCSYKLTSCNSDAAILRYKRRGSLSPVQHLEIHTVSFLSAGYKISLTMIDAACLCFTSPKHRPFEP